MMSPNDPDLHESGDYFVCRMCEGQFETKLALKEHEIYHQAPKHLCHLCSDRFYTKQSLRVSAGAGWRDGWKGKSRGRMEGWMEE